MSMLRILSGSHRRALPTAMVAVTALAGTIQCDVRAANFTWNNTNSVWSDPKWQVGVIPPTFELSGGNDVSLLAIPEPGVLLTLAAGIGTLLGLQRFRRRPPRRRD
jgi:hypothetical protein